MKKNILIAGGGISGLTAAFELSENPDLDITVIESANRCGGKMRGYFNPETNRFEEHSIRALSSTYFSLFDVFHRAGLLDMLSPVQDYKFFESDTGKSISVDRRGDLDLATIKEMIDTFDLKGKDMLQLVQRIVAHVNATEEDRKKLSKTAAGDVIGIDDFDESTRQFIVNWFGILTGARMHSKAVDIMDSFILMFMPMENAPHLPQNEFSKSYCFNRPTSEVIDALVEKLKERGVHFEMNTRLLNIDHKDESISILTNNDAFNKRAFDAAVMAVPHEVLWKIGLMPEVKKPVNDEWSFGTQFPMTEIPEVLKPFAEKSYSLSFDAPWNIVFQVQHNGSFWEDVEFPEAFRYNLSATCSSPFNKGKLFGKRFMECTPEEAKEEILFQLGITNADERKKLIKNAVIDPVYYKYTDEWEQYADIETVEFGIMQTNNKRWVSFGQIYVRNAEDKNIKAETRYKNVFLAGEIVEVPGRWKIPTMEQAATSGKQAAQAVFTYLNLDNKVFIDNAEVKDAKKFKFLNPILSGLEKIANVVG